MYSPDPTDPVRAGNRQPNRFGQLRPSETEKDESGLGLARGNSAMRILESENRDQWKRPGSRSARIPRQLSYRGH